MGALLRLSFEEIKTIIGFDIDHSFLTYKKESGQLGIRLVKFQ
jgi:hypothetical protein